MDGRLFAATSSGSILALGSPALAVASAPASGSPASGAPSIAPSGAAETVVGQFGVAAGPLMTPAGMATDAAGQIWAVEAGRDGFVIFAPDGSSAERWGVAGSQPGQFKFHRPGNAPYGDVAFANGGGFYVVDSGNFRVQQFDAKRTFVRTWGSFGSGAGQFTDPVSIALDAAGNVYVVDDARDDVQVFTSTGSYRRTMAKHGRAVGELADTGEALVLGHELFIADFGNDRLQAFDLAANSSRLVLGQGLNQPQDLKAGPAGTIVLSNYGSRRIDVISLDGRILDQIETKDGWWPTAVAVLEDGRILVAESEADGATDNGRISIYRLQSSTP